MYLFEGMSKKDKIGFIVIFLLMGAFFLAVLFFSLGKPSVDYHLLVIILSMMSTYFIDKHSSSRGLKFTLIFVFSIAYVLCKGIKDIPIPELGLIIINGVTEGIFVYFVAPPLLKITWSVLKFFGLVIQKMSEEETSQNYSGGRYSRYESEHQPSTWTKISDYLDKDAEIRDIREKLYYMEMEQNQLKYNLSNSILGFSTNNLSQSELDRNKKRYNYLSEQIEKFERRLSELEER